MLPASISHLSVCTMCQLRLGENDHNVTVHHSDGSQLIVSRDNSRHFNHLYLFFSRVSIGTPVVLCLLISHHIQGQFPKCHVGTKSPRMFHVIYNGPYRGSTDKANMQYALGDCMTADEYADDMFEHLQSRYGINLSHYRENPFRRYEDDEYTLFPSSPLFVDSDTLIYGTNQRYAKFMNTKYYWTGWSIYTKTNITTTKTTLMADRRFSYGMHRQEL